MAKFEFDHILHNPSWYENLVMFKRYIDDIFIIWKGERQQLESNIQQLNVCNERIKFTHIIEKKQIAFLVVLITIEQNTIQTNLFTKQTGRNNCLLYQSFHQESL